MAITVADIYQRLGNVIDPELGINIVKLGLIYDVSIGQVQDQHQNQNQTRAQVHIVMTLTTPGCPLSAVFDRMVRDAMFGLEGIDADHDVTLELTFDPPWLPEMMDPEARAELGFD